MMKLTMEEVLHGPYPVLHRMSFLLSGVSYLFGVVFCSLTLLVRIRKGILDFKKILLTHQPERFSEADFVT